MTNKPVLIVMAAGMGSRFGGLKQISPITPEEDLILDFSIYDAVRAGFESVVFVIKRDMEKLFHETVGHRLTKRIDVTYAFQELTDLPQGFQVPPGREKPFGTAHAVLACRHRIDSPFVVINADDYYGRNAFSLIYDYLMTTPQNKPNQFAMVSYRLDRTVTEHGHVARGVCVVDDAGSLREIVERTQIERRGNRIEFTEDQGNTWQTLADDTQVSLNFWGFQAGMMVELETRFAAFLNGPLKQNPLKAEYFLPGVVDQLLQEQLAHVQVLPSPDNWYGVTYQEDKENVSKALSQLKKDGFYEGL